MLTALQLSNFKSWRSTGPIRLAPVTALFGTNSSGKTSILQSLLLLRQTVESSDRNRVFDFGGPSSIVDLGTAQDVQYRHDSSRTTRIEAAWSDSEPLQIRDLLKQARKQSSTLISSADFSFKVRADLGAKTPEVAALEYRVGDADFTMTRRPNRDGYDLGSSTFEFKRTQGRAWPLPPPTKFYGFPDQVRLYFQNAGFLSDLELRLEQQFRRILYLGPLRDDPRRQYIFSGGAPRDVGRRGELAVDALVAARLAGQRSSRGWQRGRRRRHLAAIPTEQLIAEWLQELGLIDSFELETLDDRQTLFRITVRRSPNATPVLITDVGFGVSQVLPVLVLLAYAQSGDTVVLEQPEIHLHPSVQARLADVILEAALVRGVQVVLESHSEHLLLRLQRRVAEGALPRQVAVEQEDLALYFCSFGAIRSTLTPLHLDSLGNITNWPVDFFGNALEESVAMAEAAARRSNAG